MKLLLISIVAIGVLLSSCSDPTTKEKTVTPKALESSGSSEIKYRRDGDLLESLYRELADNTPELKSFETYLENLRVSKADSIDVFDKYNAKNQSYYQSANTHVSQIADTILRSKMEKLLAESMLRYNRNIARDTQLLRMIQTKSIALNDLHNVLKITRTAVVIEAFQQNNLPSATSLQGISQQLDKAINYADTLIKQ